MQNCEYFEDRRIILSSKSDHIEIMNPDDSAKSTTDTAIDVDIECKSILGKRSAPNRMKDEEAGNVTLKEYSRLLAGTTK